jgi:hypothetical protein
MEIVCPLVEKRSVAGSRARRRGNAGRNQQRGQGKRQTANSGAAPVKKLGCAESMRRTAGSCRAALGRAALGRAALGRAARGSAARTVLHCAKHAVNVA